MTKGKKVAEDDSLYSEITTDLVDRISIATSVIIDVSISTNGLYHALIVSKMTVTHNYQNYLYSEVCTSTVTESKSNHH